MNKNKKLHFNEIDRYSESPEAQLANIAVNLFEKLGCTSEETKDYILNKLLDIKKFDRSPLYKTSSY